LPNCVVFVKPFTVALFLGIVFSSFYHLGTSCFWGCCLLNPIVTGVPGGFSIIIFYLMQDRGIKLPQKIRKSIKCQKDQEN
jgi:hypothetical protein